MKKKILYFLLLCIAGFLIAGSYFYNAPDDVSAGIPVLNYHQVEDNANNPLALSVKNFDRQMAYLADKGYTAITADQLFAYLYQKGSLPPKPVLITFDDGYADNYTNAYPIMKKYGFTAIIFLITDVVGHDSWYMNWDQVKEMRQSGFQFGSHTLSHVPLAEVSPEEAKHQLVKSKEGIEWRLGDPVHYLAYPGGSYNQQVKDAVTAAGYKAAFTVDFGRVNHNSDPLELERVPILKSRGTFVDFYLRLNFTKMIELAKELKNSIRNK
ncbi:polysaccharide deacetylase family protein [Anaerospora sp.]|uniref:polysaccharide deacetylase family protein n=1 Tax=Anaerospora sp. TaxID=1960278 RepID=UPI00289C3C83|nr:polysaccharide deacetylase family protein [Anaerospora sp.]